MARSRNTADTQTASGGPVSPFIAGKNKIINGDFRIWQRGTSFSNPNNVYTADRWVAGTDATCTVSQQTFTPGAAPVSGYEGVFFYRSAKSAGGTYFQANQKIEDVRAFAGQTITISFWAKADSAITLAVQGYQNFGSGGSTQVTALNTSVTLTTSWARYSVTTTLPSISGKTIGTSSYLMLPYFIYSGSGAFTLDIWGVQVEVGSVATPFETATGTIQGELAACQRYYFRQTAAGITEPYAQGFAYNTTGGYAMVAIPSNMRVKPTAIEVSNVQISDWINNIATTVTIGFCVSNNVWLNFSGTGYTGFRPYVLNASNATSHLGFSAEL